MTDLKSRLALLLAYPEGKAIVEEGIEFSTDELEAAFAQVLEDFDGERRDVIEAAFKALMARRAN
jgi:hypothetical protein